MNIHYGITFGNVDDAISPSLRVKQFTLFLERQVSNAVPDLLAVTFNIGSAANGTTVGDFATWFQANVFSTEFNSYSDSTTNNAHRRKLKGYKVLETDYTDTTTREIDTEFQALDQCYIKA